MLGGRAQVLADHLLRRGVGRTEPATPRRRVPMAGTVVEQRRQVAVVGAELPVVERLVVVRVGARIEQQRDQLDRVGMGRLVAFAAAEHAGDGGERGAELLPQEARVRIGPGLEEHPECRHRVAEAEPGVAEVEQGRPVVRAGGRRHLRGLPREQGPQRCRLSAGGHGRGGGRGQRRVAAEQRERVLGPGRLGVAQARQPQERVHRPVGRTGGLHLPAPGLQHRQVLPEPGPAGEPVRPGQHPLGAGEGDRVVAGVVGGQQVERVRVTLRRRAGAASWPASAAAPDPAGRAAATGQAGAGRPAPRSDQRDRWVRQAPVGTRASFAGVPMSAPSGRKRVNGTCSVSAQVGCALSADRWRPARRHDGSRRRPLRTSHRTRCSRQR